LDDGSIMIKSYHLLEKEKMTRVVLAFIACLIATPVFADAAAGEKKVASCTTCHGNDGNSAAAAYPNLAGQTAVYLYKQIKDFKEGRRKSGVMSPMIGFMTDQDMKDVSEYFSIQTPQRASFTPDPALAAEGKKITQELQCVACHQSNFKGLNEFPRVTRQQYNYTVKQLKDFRDGVRTNDNGTMAPISKNLTDDQIKAIVHYLSTL
jgi:cytochrome c553